MKRALGFGALAGFIGSVFAANYAINKFGMVPVGFGLKAPAGVYVVGAAFLLRDVIQRTIGKAPVLGGIAVGAALSALVSPALAVASGTAFVASELTDFSIYTALQKRTFIGAVALSGVIGSVIDSYLFLRLAFGSEAFFAGQMVGKTLMTAAGVGVLLLVKLAVKRSPRLAWA